MVASNGLIDSPCVLIQRLVGQCEQLRLPVVRVLSIIVCIVICLISVLLSLGAAAAGYVGCACCVGGCFFLLFVLFIEECEIVRIFTFAIGLVGRVSTVWPAGLEHGVGSLVFA